MATFARYTVLVDRQVGESDYRADEHTPSGHDGTGLAAAGQLANELQEAWDVGGVAGHFRVTERTIIDSEQAPDLSDLPTHYEDDPPLRSSETEVTAVVLSDDYDEDRRITHIAIVRGGKNLMTVQVTPEDAVAFIEADDPYWTAAVIDRRKQGQQ